MFTVMKKFFAVAVLFGVSFQAYAQTYVDTVTINFPNHREFYTGCWIVQQSYTHLGAWCTNQYIYADEPQVSLIGDGAKPADVVIIAFDDSFMFHNEGPNGNCAYVNQGSNIPGTHWYVYQCGFDFIMHNGFDSQ